MAPVTNQNARGGQSRTHTVESAYRGRDGVDRVFVKGQPLPYFTDEPLSEGDAVVILGNRAEKAK